MSLPVVAIVGRPNVGKSELFNRLLRRRLAIVEETPGLTRDRLYAETDWSGRAFTLVDTGGLISGPAEALAADVRRQTLRAVEEADVLLFVVDARAGLLPEDAEVAGIVRQARRPVLLVANKVDDPKHESGMYEFHGLGLGAPLPVSALHGHGTGDLLDEVVALLPPPGAVEPERTSTRVAVVGRPNVGKSSLVNAVLGTDRVLVAETPGTTRDAVDTPLTYAGRPFVFVDTAGLRRRARVGDRIERFSVTRTRTALARADVAVLVLDATAAMADQDQRIAREIADAGRGLVIALNKWDLIPSDSRIRATLDRRVVHALRFVAFAPVVRVSATAGAGIDELLGAVGRVADAYVTRVPTGPLNRAVETAEAATPPPADPAGRRIKILYATQAQTAPPTVVLFVNDPRLMPPAYLRYLERSLRETFPLEGTPIRFVLRARGDGAPRRRAPARSQRPAEGLRRSEGDRAPRQAPRRPPRRGLLPPKRGRDHRHPRS
ncbi:MAG: ribosome biogenesis GTPase Der [bacterium]